MKEYIINKKASDIEIISTDTASIPSNLSVSPLKGLSGNFATITATLNTRRTVKVTDLEFQTAHEEVTEKIKVTQQPGENIFRTEVDGSLVIAPANAKGYAKPGVKLFTNALSFKYESAQNPSILEKIQYSYSGGDNVFEWYDMDLPYSSNVYMNFEDILEDAHYIYFRGIFKTNSTGAGRSITFYIWDDMGLNVHPSNAIQLRFLQQAT